MEIEAAASIERGRQWADEEKLELAARVESLAGELRGMREVLDRLAPPEPDEPAPAAPPVIVAAADSDDDGEPEAPPETGKRKPARTPAGGPATRQAD